jgi:trimethylamine---corrinoid protein Co-methyltransferase
MKLNLTAVSTEDLSRIHEASLEILSKIGCVFYDDEALSILKHHGAHVSGEKVCFSPEFIEKALNTVPSAFDWKARNDTHSTTIGKGGHRLAPSSGNVNVQDMDRGRRPALLEDVGRIQTIHQMSDVTDFVGNNPCDPSDVAPSRKHLYITREILKHTDKPLMSYCGTYPGQAGEILDMVKIAFDDDDILKKHHVIGLGVPPTSPLSYAEDVLRVITPFARANQPVLLTAAAMGGITAPIDLMGIALQQNAELLAGTVYIQLVNPGTPVVWAPSSTVAWMKTANYNTGTPEGLLPNLAILQMAKDFYHIPTRSMAGLTDAKAVDCQAGYETMQNMLMAMLGGAQIIYEALGVLDGIMTTSYEKIIIDEEIYRRGRRISCGMDTGTLKESLDLIQEVGSTGNYLAHESTLSKFRDMWQPSVSNWDSYAVWENDESGELMKKANTIWKQRLAQAPGPLLAPDIEKRLDTYVESHL